jgi:hypothetical protein
MIKTGMFIPGHRQHPPVVVPATLVLAAAAVLGAVLGSALGALLLRAFLT